jgi:hypothetical protein
MLLDPSHHELKYFTQKVIRSITYTQPTSNHMLNYTSNHSTPAAHLAKALIVMLSNCYGLWSNCHAANCYGLLLVQLSCCPIYRGQTTSYLSYHPLPKKTPYSGATFSVLNSYQWSPKTLVSNSCPFCE